MLLLLRGVGLGFTAVPALHGPAGAELFVLSGCRGRRKLLTAAAAEGAEDRAEGAVQSVALQEARGAVHRTAMHCMRTGKRSSFCAPQCSQGRCPRGGI